MIIEGIKNLLGEDLTKQVETALKGNASIDLQIEKEKKEAQKAKRKGKKGR